MTIEKLDSKTPDLTRQNIERLLELFPECRTEGARSDAPSVDFDLLKQALSDYLIEGPAERYRLDWPGKRQALLTANTPIDKTLRPMRDASVDFDTTRNLFIEGDNLDALKLLQETYLGKIKMIYIDPPYNTGKDFIYKDNFTQSREDYEKESRQRDSAGGRLVANPESNGRFHSDWLSMMHPRLKLARNLLRDDGIIFVSIDDGEAENLGVLLREVFGAKNHIATVAWQRRTSPDGRKTFTTAHDTIFVFGKTPAAEETGLYKLPMDQNAEARFSNQDEDPRGPWVSSDFTAQGYRSNQMYQITTPSGIVFSPPDGRCWKNTEEAYLRLLNEGRMWFGADGRGVPRVKTYLLEREGANSWSWWPHKEVSHTQEAKQSLNAVLGRADVFETPKPLKLLQRVINLSTRPNDTIMDFFAGAGSLQHAAFELAQEGEQRYCISVQIADSIEGSSALEAGYTSVALLSRERIRRAGGIILADNPELKGKLDTGFRTFRIDSGNFHDTRVTPKDANQEALTGMVSHIKEDRGDEDLLFGALLRWGVDITLPIEQRELAGRNVWLVDAPVDGSGKGAALIACFAQPKNGKGRIDTDLADALSELAPLRVLFRDDGFADDATKENVHSRLQQRAPDTQVRVL